MGSFSPETEVVRRLSTRKPTVPQSRQSTTREAELDPEVFEKTSSLTSTSVEDEPRDDILGGPGATDVISEAPVERIRKATTMDQARRESLIVSSSETSSTQSAVKYVKEVPAVSRAVTLQFTRKASIAEAEPKSESESLVMMRQSTLQASRRQSLRSPSPIAEEEVEPDITRQAIRQLTRRTGLLEPVVPPTKDVELNAPVLRMRRASTAAPPPTPEPEMIDQEANAEERTATPPLNNSPEPMSWKAVNRRSTERVLSPGPIVRKATTRRPTERLSSPDPVVRRVATRRPTERIPAPEPVIRHVTTLRPTERILFPEPVIRHFTTRRPTGEPPTPKPVLRKTWTCRSTAHAPLPEPVVERVLTCQSTEHSPSPEPMIRRATTRRPTERIPSPKPSIRRMITRKPTERLSSSEPTIEHALTRQATVPLPSPEEIIRRVVTGKRTESLEEPPAPPSSPSTQAEEPPLPVRVLTAYDSKDTIDKGLCEDMVVSESRAAEVPSRTATFSPEAQRQATTSATRVSTTIRRQSTQSDQIVPAESPSSFYSQASPTHEDH